MLVTLEEPPGAIKVGPIVSSSNEAPIRRDRWLVAFFGRDLSVEENCKCGILKSRKVHFLCWKLVLGGIYRNFSCLL